MHVMNCVSVVSDKDNGNVAPAAGLMIGHTPPAASPPPPPPPPPPPGLAAPPPPPGLPPPSHVNGYSPLEKKKRMRSFFWKTIPEEQVRGKTNIWTLAARQRHHYEIDAKSIEELFGQQEDTTTKAPVSKRGGALKASFREPREEITVLDAKRNMNIGIFLKQFKKSPQSIVEDIHQGNNEHYGSETLQEFLKLLPEPEEIKKLKAFTGDVSKLSLADSFLHYLIQVPNYSLRIEAMVLRKEFVPSCSSLYTDITILRTATKELMSCEELHSILHLVLQAGNIMNAGGYAGNAVGFKLSSLLKLADTKANKPGMNLLHFVAQEAQKKDTILLNFSEKLYHVQEAARLSLDSTEAELHSLTVRTRSLRENIQRDRELCQQMEAFLQFALEKLSELEHWKLELQDEAHTLIDFFCEDKETMKLDECLQIFRDFCTKFNKAVKDNQDREVKELRQQRRQRELEQKRCSWAEGELGGFGRSSSENDVQLLTKKGAEDLPPFLYSRPISPSYRPPNTRRSRLSLGATADRELLTFLEGSTDSSEDLTKFNSLPRRSPRQARPTVAWIEPENSQSDLTHGPQAVEGQVEASSPSSVWQCQLAAPRPEDFAFPRVRRRVSILRKRNSEPVGLHPGRSPPHSPLTLEIKEHELVTGLTQFDLQGSRSPVEVPQLVLNDVSPVKLAPLQEGSLQSPDTSDPSLIPCSPDSREGLDPALEDGRTASDQQPSSEALVSVGSSDLEHKEAGPLLYISDTTDCSLTLDCSETDSRPGTQEPEESGDKDGSVSSGAGETGTSQISSNPASSPPEEAPTLVSQKSEPPSKNVLPKDRATKSKDVIVPKRSSFKESAPETSKPSGTRRSLGSTSGSPSKPVRTLHASENETMRKVLPISKSSRGTRGWSRPEPSRVAPRETPSTETLLSRRNSMRGTLDTSPRRQSTGSTAGLREEQKSQRVGSSPSGTRRVKEPTLPPRSSFKKPSAKPLRNVPRLKPEENKSCCSNPQGTESPEEESKTPPPVPSLPRAPAPIPSFARSTVASSSRYMRTDTPLGTKAPGLTRAVSQRQLRVKGGPEDSSPKDSPLRRASSARTHKKGPESPEGNSVSAEAPLKGRGSGERASFRQKDSKRTTLGKILNPLRK
ncbi:PREDICTED: FH2 domain-containing protein 1 [Elephantulus edwardii]|uniref:FH2 domain-containing protein 1 n=1 Tax=Elephantulus edwardii TaxID=28737 RepID=UPI0003F094AF|nr:PREDICTED: FH2 domain-containing protein 1 [Elephantulus edwardii]